MTSLESVAQLVDALRPDYSPDYWADEVDVNIGLALAALSDEEWPRLASAIATEPPGPRVRLAEALRHTPSDRATELLVALLRSPEPEVGIAATKSLFEQYRFWLPDVSLSDELQRHLNAAPPELRSEIEALLARVTN